MCEIFDTTLNDFYVKINIYHTSNLKKNGLGQTAM